MIDDTNLRILEILQENARTTTSEIGRRLGIAQSAVHERIRKMQERGLIEGFTTRLSTSHLGLKLTAFVLVRTLGHDDAVRVAAALTAIDEVQEVHHVAGEDCLLIKVRVEDNAALWELFKQRIRPIDGISGMRTTIVLETAKDSSDLPLGRVPVA